MLRLLLALPVALASCVRQAPADPATPAAVVEPERGTVPKIVDLCVQSGPKRAVCVLLDDGRLACAQTDGDRMVKPPLAGVTGAVELACGKHSICTRDAAGSITCLDNSGKLRHLDSIVQSRSLAPDCAISQDGALSCWDESFEISHQRVPAPSPHEILDLQRVIQDSQGRRGCALHHDGELWCWGNYPPRNITTLDRTEGIRELKLDENDSVCWRRTEGWFCTDGKREPWPGFPCDHRLCTCAFEDGRCMTGDTEIPESMTVPNVVLHDEACVVDLLGRVLCQGGDQPPWELPLTGESSARSETFVRPPPQPEPLPDPQRSDCPKAVAVSNRVCNHFSGPDGPLACREDDWICPRRCGLTALSYDCEPDEFVVAYVGREAEGAPQHVVYVDDHQLWLGPRLEMGTSDPYRADRTMPTTIVVVGGRTDRQGHTVTVHTLTAIMVCRLVDGRPVCSLPIAMDWSLNSYEQVADVEDPNILERIEYEADVEVTSTDVLVTVREGKRHANSSHPFVDGTRVLPTGTHSLESLLDQSFVILPE